MKTLTLVLVLLAASAIAASAQEAQAPVGAVVESTEVSGLQISRLSPGLRQAIDAVAGSPLDADRLSELAARIESERPDVVAAVRTVALPDGKARVIFLVAPISEDAGLRDNINGRYVVERVSIAGVPETDVSRTLRDELQTLVGQRLDHERAERLRQALADELSGRVVRRRIVRGSQQGRIEVIFDVTEPEPPPWIPFAPSRSKVIYQEDLGWTGVLDVPIGGQRNRATLGFVFGDKDDLIVNYSGYRFRFESRKLVSDRLGASLELAWLKDKWNPATLAEVDENPAIPQIDDERRTVEPSVTFAFNRHARVSAGVSTTELQASDSSGSRMANAVTASVAYGQTWHPSAGGRQRLQASYTLRATTDALESDLSYRRHAGLVQYEFEQRQNTIIASVAAGWITGQAPLFERFTLGDSSTLRGWNKFDIAPAGADRMWRESIEYQYRHFALFLDAGALWQPRLERRTRLSTGFGYHGDNVFATFGIPLNADDVAVTFLTGVRF